MSIRLTRSIRPVGLAIALLTVAFALAPASAGAAFGPLGEDLRLSFMGPDGSASFSAKSPSVAYNPTANEYLVVWQGNDNIAPLLDDEVEIFGQRLSGSGAPLGARIRISQQGAAVTPKSTAQDPSVAYNRAANEYLVAWRGEIGTSKKFEIFGPAAVRCRRRGRHRRLPDLRHGPGAEQELPGPCPQRRRQPDRERVPGRLARRRQHRAARRQRVRDLRPAADRRRRPDRYERLPHLRAGCRRQPAVVCLAPERRLQPGRERVSDCLAGRDRRRQLPGSGVRDLDPAPVRGRRGGSAAATSRSPTWARLWTRTTTPLPPASPPIRPRTSTSSSGQATTTPRRLLASSRSSANG